MARSLSATILAAANAQTTSQVILALLDFSHSTFSANIRLVNNNENVTSNGNVYTAAPFAITLPPEGEDFTPVMRIRTQNVDRSLIDNLRDLAANRERIKCTVTVIAAADPDTALDTFSNFEVVNVVYDAVGLEFDLSIASLLNEPFPRDSFTPNTAPGIF